MVAPRTNMWSVIRRYGDDRLRKRLKQLLRHDDPQGCWEITLRPMPCGYAKIKIGRDHAFLAHRVAWALANNAEPGEMLVCHTCDNRPCCNPAHLFLGTPLDNTRDMALKGRRAIQRGPRNRKRGTKLALGDIAAIRSDERPTREIAEAFGISIAHTRNIRARRAWDDAARAERRSSEHAHRRRSSHIPKVLSDFHSTAFNTEAKQ